MDLSDEPPLVEELDGRPGHLIPPFPPPSVGIPLAAAGALVAAAVKTNYELVHFFDLWKQVGTPDSPHSWAYAWLPKDKMIGFAEGLERHGKRAGKQLKEAVEVAQGLIGV
eukprot:CAMPEP_0174924426 /NCGR_PEP_ID=MMETSP1355-20121228/7242_1 /TAXON_ID=464990 /ORGANISM="Hemiselmis tepida, Strain CCMP443" /LENGTH=110 /DNA_ID=CAMNT_0016170231 /DNA_START=36 /DNA_END=369 /DNA_ORIENTATION=-